MIDSHYHPENWGILPILFRLGSFSVSSYSFFVLLALFVGAFVFYLESKKQKFDNEPTFIIAVAALLGGAIGAKIIVWLIYFPQITAHPTLESLLSGRSIIGGFIGGITAVVITKKIFKIQGKRGNLFAPAIALGLSIGRVGCFLRGCCYGITTSLPWGVDFGDGILRHPTQLYESVFSFGMFFYLQYLKTKNPKPGELLRIFLIYYFIFRFFLEFIKYEPKTIGPLTIYQIVAILVLGYLLRDLILVRLMALKHAISVSRH